MGNNAQVGGKHVTIDCFKCDYIEVKRFWVESLCWFWINTHVSIWESPSDLRECCVRLCGCVQKLVKWQEHVHITKCVHPVFMWTSMVRVCHWEDLPCHVAKIFHHMKANRGWYAFRASCFHLPCPLKLVGPRIKQHLVPIWSWAEGWVPHCAVENTAYCTFK